MELEAARRTLVGGEPLAAVREGSWCCLLCERRFRSERHICRHLRRSEMHRDAYAAALRARRLVEPSGAIKRGRETEPDAAHGSPGLRPSKAPLGLGVGVGGNMGVSAIEQMELVQQRLAAASKVQKRQNKREEDEVDSNRARSINNQMDWECGECSTFNFARVVTCISCRHHVDGNTRYLTNRLKELKQERFAKVFGSSVAGMHAPKANADGSMPGGYDRDARASFQS